MSAASAIYFLNLRGDVILYRLYRDDAIGRNAADTFRTQILQSKDGPTACPVKIVAGVTYAWMRVNNVYVLTATKSNVNIALTYKYMSSVIELFKAYFGNVNEDSLRSNFVLIYELLDETLDYGYPQILTPNMLQLYITQKGVKGAEEKWKATSHSNITTMQVTGAVGHRREGIKYKKNEVFLDIIESINLLMSAKGTVLRSDVMGKVMMKCFLSGMPDLKLGLNDKLTLGQDGGGGAAAHGGDARSAKAIELDDLTFHQCVNLSRFHTDRCVNFVPPDGEFELMRYRISEAVQLPFKVLPIITEHGRSRVECQVKIKSTFGAKLIALGVIVRIPVPKHTAKAHININIGKAKYNASESCIVWKIRRFPGQMELGLTANVDLASTTLEKKAWSRPPVNLEFQVPMFTASGLRVRFLKVWEKAGYNTVKWVRYVTRAGPSLGGSYDIRCS